MMNYDSYNNIDDLKFMTPLLYEGHFEYEMEYVVVRNQRRFIWIYFVLYAHHQHLQVQPGNNKTKLFYYLNKIMYKTILVSH